MMRSDTLDHFLKTLNKRNGKAGATRLLLHNGYGGKLSPQDKDELLICSRISQAKTGA